MERPEFTNHDDGDATAPTQLVEASKPKIEENTGLFDIRTLANMTKKRISERITTEHDVEEALLASASATALSTISLPDMSTELEPYVGSATGTMDAPLEAPEPFAVLDNPESVAAPAAPLLATAPAVAAPMTAHPMPLDKPTPLWVFGAVAGVVALGAVSFLVLRGGGAAEVETPEVTEAVETAPAPSAKPLEEPVAQPLVDEPAPEPVPEPDVAMVADEEDKAPEPKADKVAEKKNYKRTKKSAPAKSDDKALKDAIDARKLKKSKASKKIVDTSDEKKDIDQLLDQAAVGSALAPKAVKEEVKKPTRTEITRSDVKTSMHSISGKAKGCYNLYEKEGTVQIRFTVEPSGKVSKAKAAGKFKGTDTGKCVASAVKRAKFPAYDGAPKSFTYPFLLSP